MITPPSNIDAWSIRRSWSNNAVSSSKNASNRSRKTTSASGVAKRRRSSNTIVIFILNDIIRVCFHRCFPLSQLLFAVNLHDSLEIS
jgi:hypothetical protein